ncbi:MAG: SDR family oxidoreductase [Nannocystaceae bacterium]
MKRFTDRIAVVTGAASGIGRATSVALAQRGCDLAIVDLNEEGLAETAAHIEKTGRKVTQHIVDVADRAQMKALADTVVEAHGAVHIVINNAGVTVSASFARQSLDDFEWLMGINFWGVIHGCKFFLPHLGRAEEAHIVNISSLFGLIGVPTQTSYCASKFAVRGFSDALRFELEDTRVGLTCVHPGGINTNIIRNSRYTEERRYGTRARIQRVFDRAMPPEEAANLIVDAIAHNKERLLITREAHLGDLVMRLLPQRLSARLLTKARRKLGM